MAAFGVPNDEVLCTLDVVVHHDYDGKLCVSNHIYEPNNTQGVYPHGICRHKITHPLRPEYRAPEKPAAARIRPERATIQVEYNIPRSGAHFDTRAHDDPRMRRLRHTSADVPMKALHYVGVVNGGCLHLHGLHGLRLMSPDMSHLEGEEKREEKPAEATRITPHFKRTDERAVAARKASYAAWKEKEESDAFVQLTTYSADSIEAEVIHKALADAPTDDDEWYEWSAKAGEELTPSTAPDAATTYLHKLATKSKATTSTTGIADLRTGITIPNKGPLQALYTVNMERLRSKPITLQVEEMLRRTSALPLSRLLQLVNGGSKEIFDATNKIARLVRGNYVIKSELLFKPHWTVRIAAMEASLSKATGPSTTAKMLLHQYSVKPQAYSVLCAYRDYILGRFSESPFVSCTQCMQSVGMSKQAFLQLIRSLADNDPADSDIWHFKLLDDVDFQAAFPVEAAKEAKHWNKRVLELESFFATNDATSGHIPPDTGHKDLPDDHETVLLLHKASKPATAAATAAAEADEVVDGLDAETNHTSPLPTPLQRAASDSKGSISGTNSLTTGSSGVSSLTTPLPKVAADPKGSALISSGEIAHGHILALQQWVQSVLHRQGVVSAASFRALLFADADSNKDIAAIRKFLEEKSGGNQKTLQTNADALLTVPLSSIAAHVAEKKLFVQDMTSSPLVDRYRTPIIRHLAQHNNVKKKVLEEMLLATLGEVIPETSINKVLKEVAVSSGTSWNLKSGDVLSAASGLSAAAEEALNAGRKR